MKFFKSILIVLGIAVVAWLIIDTGVQNIADEISRLGLNVAYFLVPYCFVYIFDTLGWKYSFGRDTEKLSYSNLFSTRMAGEAINYVTPTAYIGGEPVKAYMLKEKGIPLAHGMASVIVGKFIMTITEVVFIIIGLEFAVTILGQRGPLFWGISCSLLLLSILLVTFLFMQRRGLGTHLSNWAQKAHFFSYFFCKNEDGIREFDRVLTNYYRKEKLSIVLSSLFYFLGWCFGALEIYIFFRLFGLSPDLKTIFAIEAIAVAVKGAGFFLPGSVGVQEAGQVSIFMLFGYDQSLGVTFSILRRLREVFWIMMGLLFLGKNWRILPEVTEKDYDNKIEKATRVIE